MKEDEIIQVANILEEWNPLSEGANSIDDLDGYRIEAIDIISSTNIIYGTKKVKMAIETVLTQAFGIELDQSKLTEAAIKIEAILTNRK